MTDYGHDLQFGAFITPTAKPAMHAVDLAIFADQAGLDLVTFQDHPYQPNFLDTWTLLSYVASRTKNIHVSGNVMNLPLRNPAVLARSAASLDLLSNGRVELGIGSGGFVDAIASMGGRHLTPPQQVQAVEEAITIIRDIWDADRRGGVRLDGEIYQINGAKRGPAPVHDIGIWVGAYKPRMLKLVGRLADGSLPSLPYLPGGPAGLDELNKSIDEGAASVDRDPGAVRRLLNISGQFASTGGDLLVGPPAQWAEQLAEIALNHGISTFILATDDALSIERYASDVAPATRELVANERKMAPTKTVNAIPQISLLP